MRKEKKMTKAEMRVAVAKDVLRQIEAEKYIAQSGTYLQFGGRVREFFRKLFKRDDKRPSPGYDSLKDYLPKILSEPCHVCAKGAMVLSYAKLFNKAPLRSILDEEGMSGNDPFDHGERLIDGPWKEVFGDEAEEIESAFEDYWKGEYPDDTERLIAIMKNVIKNKGTFKL